MTIELAAGGCGVAMSLAPTRQIRRMVSSNSSRGVSLDYLTVLEVGFVLYLAYGLSIDNRVLIIANTVSLIANSAALMTADCLAHRTLSESPRR